MTRRNPMHGETVMLIGHELLLWLGTQPISRGKVVGGEAGFPLKVDPVTFVGIDGAYVSPAMAAGHDRRRKFLDGPLVLAVEILSPSDLHEDVVEKVEIYPEVATVVWVAIPDFGTVAVHQPGQPPVTSDDRQEIDGDPCLPGFRGPVARSFEA